MPGQVVSVIVVNYRTPGLAAVAVDSALASGGVSPRAIVVENACDGAWARERFGADSRVGVIANAGNPGFGAACNQGIEQALADGADFVCLLNSDARLDPGALRHLAPVAARLGMACPRILRPDGCLYATGGLFEPWLARCRNRDWGQPDRGQNNVPSQMAFGSACALMFSRAALEAGERFDEPLFLYYEDADLCLRLRAKGFKIGYAPEARALHQDGGSMRADEASATPPTPTFYYNTRNRWVLLRRHGTPAQRVVGGLYLAATVALKALVAKWRGRPEAARQMLDGLRDGLAGRMGPRA
jgi:GT2 family glycosyltransferase